MNPRELRIGNWYENQSADFKPNGRYSQVKNIDDLHFAELMLPIPLTHEWLERFGFKNIGTDDYHSKDLYKKEGCDWKYCLEGYFSQYFCEGHSEPATVGDINYVHQLQNAYFVVTGEELTIENPQ